MGIISDILLNRKSNCALIPFVTAGYPTLDSTIDILSVLSKSGADIIEIGIPYADALADGPIIQESSKIALEQGVNIDQVMDMLKVVVPYLNLPIIIFTYYNSILAKGVESFVSQSARSGVSGLIVPDLPLEEADYLTGLCFKYSIELILFIAPTSSNTRIHSILSKSPGCIYLVSACGVTGMRDKISYQIINLIKKIKDRTNKAIILGFGISNVQQVSEISTWNIDGIVMGSSFINKMVNKSPQNAVNDVGSFCTDIRYAIDKKVSN